MGKKNDAGSLNQNGEEVKLSSRRVRLPSYLNSLLEFIVVSLKSEQSSE